MICIQNKKSILKTVNDFFSRAGFFCTEHTVLCLTGLLILSLCLKLAEHFLDPQLGRDASYYCHMAQDWYENGVINRFSWTPPLLTFLMKSCATIGISVQTAGLTLSILAGVLCTLAAYGIALETTDNKKTALIAAAFCAVHPGINTVSIQIGRDALYLCLAGFTVWCALAGIRKKSCLLWCISGVFCSLSLLARFETLEFLPIAGCLLLVYALRRKLSWKQAGLYGFCFSLFTAVSFYGAIRGMKAEEMFQRYQKYFKGKIAGAEKQYFKFQTGGQK